MMDSRRMIPAEWLHEESIAKTCGWDFSHIDGRYKEYPLSWSYGDIISKYLKPTDKLLDIDTGGGEFLDTVGHPEGLTYVTEGYAPNVELCREKYADTDVVFTEMTDYEHMPFDDESFDVIINRHGTYDAKELYRVLKKGGIFITQQVGAENDRELVEKLLPGCPRQFHGHDLASQTELFFGNGFEILESGEELVPMEFYDTGAVVWFARIIQWEFIDFSVKRCFEELCRIDREIKENGKVVCNAHRFYFAARK